MENSSSADPTYYSNAVKEFYSFRGHENKQKRFRVLVVDRWNNYSLPKDTVLTPEFEEYVVRKNTAGVALWERYGYTDKTTEWRGDYPGQYSSNAFSRLFDGSTTSYFHLGTAATYSLPVFTKNSGDKIHDTKIRTFGITIDMTEEVKLSRMKYYFIKTTNFDNELTKWNVWGSNISPKGPSDFNNDRIASLAYWTNWEEVGGTDAWKNDWVLLAECHMIPPSGALEDFEWTDDDKAWAMAGVDFDFDLQHTNKRFRYLRIECIRNFKNNNTRRMGEMEFYGSCVNK